MNRIFILITLFLLTMPLMHGAVSFGQFFTDSTLRIDYTLSGNARAQHIAVTSLQRSPGWGGRRVRLDSLPVQGDGQVTVRDKGTGQVIYRQSFSTLFSEFLTYPEAQRPEERTYECVMQVPMPRGTALVTLDLRDKHHRIMATTTHEVDPADILIRRTGEQPAWPAQVVQQPADPKHCIRLTYVAEGYTAAQMTQFLADVKQCAQWLFEVEPFKSLKSRFMVTAVLSASTDSGASEPAKGLWRRTVLGSHWDTFYSSRYLTTEQVRGIYDAVAGCPTEHVIVLVNSDRYGGGGIYGQYLLATARNRYTKQVVVHEFGHSFCGLADEYAYESEQLDAYPRDVEPWERNITTRVDFRGKWEHISGAGFYEGAGYSLKGVYRAYPDCRMRSNVTPDFCKACQKAIADFIHFYTDP